MEWKSVSHEEGTLAYVVEGSGPPVLMVQGVGVHGTASMPQLERMSTRYAFATFDNRGIGKSPWNHSRSPLTVEQMAGDVLRIMDAESWDSAHLMGHSLGGLVSLVAAIQSPDRIRSLSLLCTFASGKDVAPLTLRMCWLGMRSSLGTRSMRRRGFFRLVLPPNRPYDVAYAEYLASLFGHDLADQPAIVPQQLKAMRRCHATPFLSKLSGIPALIACGAHDPIAPPQAGQKIAQGLAGSRFVEFKDASHGLTITHADQLQPILDEHIAKAEVRWRNAMQENGN